MTEEKQRAEDYESWYHTPRGRWIGTTEFNLLYDQLQPKRGETLLDIGCGTGYFTRHFAQAGLKVTGVDPNRAWLEFAQDHSAASEIYMAGRAESLPFGNASFDYSVSVAALCFVSNQPQAIREVLRVTRKRFAIGLLNRHSLLYLKKGKDGGKGGYEGARWDSATDLHLAFEGLPVSNLSISSAVFMPHGGALSKAVEHILPTWLALGAFIVVSGNVESSSL